MGFHVIEQIRIHRLLLTRLQSVLCSDEPADTIMAMAMMSHSVGLNPVQKETIEVEYESLIKILTEVRAGSTSCSVIVK
jgi:hypothetical protein